MARSRGEIHWLWRLLLLPLFVLYLKLFDQFDFIWHIGSIQPIDYAWNFALLGVCAAGLVCLMCSSPNRRALAALGMLLLLAPEIPEFGTRMGGIGISVSSIRLTIGMFVIRATGTLWGLLMMRGPKKREWEKVMLWLFLLARIALLNVWKDAEANGYFWYNDVRLFALSIVIGAAADSVQRGPCLADLLTPVVAGGWLLAAGILPVAMDIRVVLYIVVTLCLVYATVLMCAKPARNFYWGFIFALTGLIANAAVYLFDGLI